MFTKEELKAQIRAMGILPTDTVLVHSSLRAIGPTENGADGIIDAFREVLTEGLLLIPTHTWAVVTKKQPVFDVRATVPNIGALPRVAAFRPDGVRSLHPTHSIAGFGKNAAEFLAGEELSGTPTPVGGAMQRLGKLGAKILLVGVGNDKNTFLHTLDEELEIPDRMERESYPLTILDAASNRYTTQFRSHHCSRSEDVSMNYPNYEQALVDTGAQVFGKLGSATVRIVDAAKCRETVKRILKNADRDVAVAPMTIPTDWYRTP